MGSSELHDCKGWFSQNAHVIASAPEGYFEEAALDAVGQWIYEPIREDREPAEYPGIRIMLSFGIAP